MEKYFYLDESPIYRDKHLIRVNVEKMFFPNGTRGSYNVLIARVLGLSYTDYLRYVRDKLGAELIGKNRRYVVPYFDLTPEVKMFINVLNKRMTLIMFNRDHPYNLKEDENGKIIKIPFKKDESNN